jgi:hypothetical protein
MSCNLWTRQQLKWSADKILSTSVSLTSTWAHRIFQFRKFNLGFQIQRHYLEWMTAHLPIWLMCYRLWFTKAHAICLMAFQGFHELPLTFVCKKKRKTWNNQKSRKKFKQPLKNSVSLVSLISVYLIFYVSARFLQGDHVSKIAIPISLSDILFCDKDGRNAFV